MVRVPGIEPGRPKATDFKSVTSTYSVTLALSHKSLKVISRWIGCVPTTYHTDTTLWLPSLTQQYCYLFMKFFMCSIDYFVLCYHIIVHSQRLSTRCNPVVYLNILYGHIHIKQYSTCLRMSLVI